MRDCQVTITPSIRYPVRQAQRDSGIQELRGPETVYHRHPVTDFRDTSGMPFIGRNIKKARDRLGLSQGDLADRSGLAPSTISDLENERQKSTTKIHRVAKALNMTVEELERGDLPKEANDQSVARAYLSEREEELLRLFRAATPAVKRAIEGAAGKAPEPAPEPSAPESPRRHRQ
jgi:transcriptional regulator with XRE-family HTH domain